MIASHSAPFFEMAICGEMFYSTLQANVEWRPGFDLETRLEFIRYCILTGIAFGVTVGF